MKNPRAILWIGLVLLLFVNVQFWIGEFTPRDAAAAAAQRQALEQQKRNDPLSAAVPTADLAPAAAPGAAAGAVPVPGAAAVPGAIPDPAAAAATPPTPAETAGGDVPSVAPPVAAATPSAVPAERVLNVRTDVLDVDLSLRGADIVRADLLLYPVHKGGDERVRLMRANGPGDQYLLQTGLAGAVAGARAEDFPTHLAALSTPFNSFRLEQGMAELKVPFTWTSPSGVEVTKTLTFRRGSYRIDVEYQVRNGGTTPWAVAPYAQIQRDMPPAKRSYFNVDSYSFTGPAYWDGGKYEKLKIDKDEAARFNQQFTGGWFAALQHHFVAAIVPPLTETHHFSLNVRENEFLARDLGPTLTVAPGESTVINQTLFVGPKLQKQLEGLHPELGRAADFGLLTFLSRPLFWLLEKAHTIFGNWGLAIIAVTFLLKLLFYPLSEASGKSMAKMKLVAPRMKQLQETYKDDKQKLGTAMMELYKKEKVNPAAGCLPMLIQLPVFLAFYWVLLESVEMRQAPFVGWIQDLSSRDPFFILPAIMAGAMFLQYKLQPTPADPIQAKVFMILPLVMSVTFAFFPAGLVLYWVTNTLLTIAQQWNINRRIEAQRPARD
jgi:YidC/Oxa1 family membrane protein insertase